MAVDVLKFQEKGASLFCERDRRRLQKRLAVCGEALVDEFGGTGLEIRFLRLRLGVDHTSQAILLPMTERLTLGGGWGHVGRSRDGSNQRTMWVPRAPRLLLARDSVGRVEILPPLETGWKEGERGEVSCSLPTAPHGSMWSLPLVFLDDLEGQWFRHFEWLSWQVWPQLMKSDWFRADSPSDLWDSLIDGSVFDPRESTCGKGRFRCQQCAGAWWSYLHIAGTESGSPLMSLLAREVAWSARVQLEEPGGWRHGYWNEEPETHVRFFVDGIDLLLNEAAESGDESWVIAAEGAMNEVVDRFSDRLPDDGLWFLHDSIEAAGTPPRNTPPCLGQSRGNSLCLNTHVQTLIVLSRLAKVQSGEQSAETRERYKRGMAALRRILELDSAPAVYRFLGACVRPVVESKNRPGLTARVIRVLAFRVFQRLYWWLRRRYPRIAYPNGFIERDMASSMLADDYHVLNLKDLLLLYALDPQPWIAKAVVDGFGFLQSLDLRAARGRSPLFIEVVDVHRLFARFLGRDGATVVGQVSAISHEGDEARSLDDALWSLKP